MKNALVLKRKTIITFNYRRYSDTLDMTKKEFDFMTRFHSMIVIAGFVLLQSVGRDPIFERCY